MRTSFLNFQLSQTITPYKKLNNKEENKTAGVSFQGAQKKDDMSSFYSMNVIPFFKNPTLCVQNRLISDGFEKSEIEDWDIYCFQEDDESIQAGLKAFESDYKALVKKTRNQDSILKAKKQSEDIHAMSRVYSAMKQKFQNEDTKEYAEAFLELSKVFEDKFGIKTPEDKPVKDLILQTLSYTNRYNEPVILALLDDENFNNINIPQAIAGIKTKEQMEASMIALTNAKQAGCKKEFSLPLAIIINSATPKNIPVITKILGEQEFLIQNKEFVSDKLARFLNEFNFLSSTYVKDDAMTLQEVEDLINVNDEYYDNL